MKLLAEIFKGSGSRRHGDDEVRERAAVTNLLRLHANETDGLKGRLDAAEQRADNMAAYFQGAAARYCPAGKHPKFWVVESAPAGCPWCLYEAEWAKSRRPAPPVAHAAGRVPASAQVLPLRQRPGISVPACKDLPGFRESGQTAAETVADQTLADLARQGDPDPQLLTGLGLSITVVDEALDERATVLLPAQRLHGAETTAAMPSIEVTADHLEPARVPLPPKPEQPPLVPLADLNLSLTWGVNGEPVDATGRSRRVELTKAS